MRIAIIGSGIAGLSAAWLLNRRHQVTLYERNDYFGGHTNTRVVETAAGAVPVDTGFIVFNDVTYPNFIALLDELGVESQASDMSFSVSSRRDNLEYNGATLNTLFAQRSNLIRPSFYRMLKDILRFNREAPALLEGDRDGVSLGDYLDANGYSWQFMEHYILPMGAAIWSATPEGMRWMPAEFFIRFFHNHGLLTVDGWKHIILPAFTLSGYQLAVLLRLKESADG